MKRVSRAFFAVAFLLHTAIATAESSCPGTAAVANFRLLVTPGPGVQPLPIEKVNTLRAGWTVTYVPGDPGSSVDLDKAQVVLLLLSASAEELRVLERKPALGRQHWVVPTDAMTVALAWGPSGLDDGRVKSMLAKDHDLVSQLAEYSERTTQTETMMEAALRGFSVTGVSSTKLDKGATIDQNTLTMMRALNPTLAAYDPLAPQPQVRWQQSAGLAAAAAGLFFGNTVVLASTGTALFLNLRSAAFPKTELRAALRHDSNLCAKKDPNTNRARLAYLWARKLPLGQPPALHLAGTAHLAQGAPGEIAFAGAKPVGFQKWSLVDETGHAFPLEDPGAVTKLPGPGNYSLRGEWDWQTVQATGTVQIHPLPALGFARLSPDSADRLVAGHGKVRLELEGADFQFLTGIEVERVGDALAEKQTVRFAGAPGPRPVQEIEVDTSGLKPGPYRFRLTQRGGSMGAFTAMVHEEPPQLSGLPWRVRPGTFALQGERLEQIERIEYGGGTIALHPDRSATLTTEKPEGEWDLEVWVAGRNRPLRFEHALAVRPAAAQVVEKQRAAGAAGSVELGEDEIDATQAVSFSLRVSGPVANPRPNVACGKVETVRALGADRLFVTIRPEAPAGAATCAMAVTLEEGSKAFPLGRVVRLPRLDALKLSAEAAAAGQYWGVLEGQELESIERVGWDANEGVPVTEVPAPGANGQTLRVAVPWPSPAPHAPLYIWLRGEEKGRATRVHD